MFQFLKQSRNDRQVHDESKTRKPQRHGTPPRLESLEERYMLDASLGTPSFEAQLALRWAPVHYQDVDTDGGIFGIGDDSLEGKSDYITAIDFDGDWDTQNNWENIENHPAKAYAYYSVVTSATHWFIVYGFYHPRDWTSDSDPFNLDSHENDMEGLLAIVKRPLTTTAPNNFGTLQGIVTMAHTDLKSYVTPGSSLHDVRPDGDFEGTLLLENYDGNYHPMTQQEENGHGLYGVTADDPVHFKGDDGVRYVPTLDAAEEPEGPEDGNVKYQLVSMFQPGGLWDHRHDRATFAEWGTFRGDDGKDNAAVAPWLWDDKQLEVLGVKIPCEALGVQIPVIGRCDDGLEPGEIAYDPARLADRYFDGDNFSRRYISHPYAEIARIPYGTPGHDKVVFFASGFFNSTSTWTDDTHLFDSVREQGGVAHISDWNNLHHKEFDFSKTILDPSRFPLSDGGVVSDMVATLDTFDESDTVILVGYSFGADSLLKAANGSTRQIDLLAVLDPVGAWGTRATVPQSVPGNVRYLYNRWETCCPTIVPLDHQSSGELRSNASNRLATDYCVIDQAELHKSHLDFATEDTIESDLKKVISDLLESELATYLGDGVLRLNMGPYAQARLSGDLSDGNETFTVSPGPCGGVVVEAFGFVTRDFHNVSKIIADGGVGNDSITIQAGVTASVELNGGASDDTLTAGTGSAQLRGGPGNDQLRGSDTGDQLFGDAGDDRLWGGPGSDRLQGNDGNDTILGEGGSDTLLGGEHDDILYGGSDKDTLVGDRGSDTLYGGDGADRLSGDEDDNAPGCDQISTISSGTHKDLLLGESGDDLLCGNIDDDTLNGGPGRDQLYGGDGSDRLEVGFETDGTLIDDLFGGQRDDTAAIVATNDPDRIVLFYLKNDTYQAVLHTAQGVSLGSVVFTMPEDVERLSIFAGDGDDVVTVGAAVVKPIQIEGGRGNDTLTGAAGRDTLLGGPGDDILVGLGAEDSLRGGAGDDTLEGGESNDELHGDEGNDQLNGGADRDLQYGGVGNDWIDAGPSFYGDVQYGEDGNDTLVGGDGVDVLNGDAGDDCIFGGGLIDVMQGGPGNDLLVGESGRDFLFGGDGNDRNWAEFNDQARSDVGLVPVATPAVVDRERLYDDLLRLEIELTAKIKELDASLNTATGTISDATWAQLRQQRQRLVDQRAIINLGQVDGDCDQKILVDMALGEGGDDTLYGSACHDLLAGGSGNDTIHYSPGEDTIQGGDGTNDEYIVPGTTRDDVITIDFKQSDQAPDFVEVNVNSTIRYRADLPGIEIVGVDAAAGDDQITVKFGMKAAMKVHIQAGEGNDLLDASTLQHQSTLRGGPGDDTLKGGSTTDMIYGDAGDDLLYYSDAPTQFPGDTYDGGPGRDSMLIQGTDAADTIRITTDEIELNGHHSAVASASVDFYHIEGLGGDDTLKVDASGPDKVVLVGGDGNDTLTSEAGDSELRGGDGDDHLAVGPGNQHIDGGLGINSLNVFGSDGADSLVLSVPSDTPARGRIFLVPGRVGQAFQIDSGGYLAFPDSAALDASRYLSVAGWIRIQSLEEYQPVFRKGFTEYTLVVNPEGALSFVSISARTGTSGYGTYRSVRTSANVITPNSWHHFAVVIDSDNSLMQVYVDGQLQATGPYDVAGIQDSFDPLFVGYPGMAVDEFQLYHRVLTAGEIAALYRTDDLRLPASADLYSDPSVGSVTSVRIAGNASDQSQSFTATALNVLNVSVDARGGNDLVDASRLPFAVAIDGGAGSDSVIAGSDNATIRGGSGNDFLQGGVGDDSIDGGEGEDTLYGGDGNDSLDGGAGHDLLNAAGRYGGDDRLFYSPGDDAYDGRGGFERLVYRADRYGDGRIVVYGGAFAANDNVHAFGSLSDIDVLEVINASQVYRGAGFGFLAKTYGVPQLPIYVNGSFVVPGDYVENLPMPDNKVLIYLAPGESIDVSARIGAGNANSFSIHDHVSGGRLLFCNNFSIIRSERCIAWRTWNLTNNTGGVQTLRLSASDGQWNRPAYWNHTGNSVEIGFEDAGDNDFDEPRVNITLRTPPAGPRVPAANVNPPVAIENVPENQVIEATSPNGAAVHYSAPTAANLEVSCSIPSGTTLGVGTHAVVCSTEPPLGTSGKPLHVFSITVQDTTAPQWQTLTGNIVVAAASADGAMVEFNQPAAVDLVDTTPTVTCSAASGSPFPLGETTVSCMARDASDNESEPTTFTVTVVDRDAPTWDPATLPGDMTLEAIGPGGAEALFGLPHATDAVDGRPSVVCRSEAGLTSGSMFPLGNTLVTCTGIDEAGNPAEPVTFSVVVRDTSPPVLFNVPLDMLARKDHFDYVPPTAHDAVTGDVPVTCSVPPRTTLPLEVNDITCWAEDRAGNPGSARFTVTVQDMAPPVLTLPADISKEADDPAGAVVSYRVTANDLVDGPVNVSCTPSSGDLFPLGETRVTCTAKDSRGNEANGSFKVTVQDTQKPRCSTGLVNDTGARSDDLITRDGTVQVTCSDAVGVTGMSVLVDGSPVMLDANSRFAVPNDGWHDGRHPVAVTVSDAAGNIGTAAFDFLLDTMAPKVSARPSNDTGLRPDDLVTRDGRVAVDGGEGATVDVLLDGRLTLPSSGIIEALTNGRHLVEVTSRDAAGNVGTATLDFILDMQPPQASARLVKDTGISSSDGLTKDGRVRVSCSEGVMTAILDGTPKTPSDGILTADGDGSHRVQVGCTDEAGNQASPGDYRFTLDTRGPSMQSVDPVRGSNQRITGVRVLFTEPVDGLLAAGAGNFQVQFGGRSVGIPSASWDGDRTVMLGLERSQPSRLTPTVSITRPEMVVDRAGNSFGTQPPPPPPPRPPPPPVDRTGPIVQQTRYGFDSSGKVTAIYLDFNEKLDASRPISLTENYSVWTTKRNGRFDAYILVGSATYDGNRTVTLTLAQPIRSSQTIQWSIVRPENLTDLAGNAYGRTTF